MKIVSFNIRCDYDQDGDNNFSNRKPLIEEKINKESADVICFQEVLPHVATWLKETFNDYYFLGCGRDENLEDEQTTIGFKKLDYQLLAMNTFWLSKEPYVPASRYKDQSACPRTCTEVLIENIKSKKVYRIINTHLDHIGSSSRVLAVKQIIAYIDDVKLFKDATTLIAGDFNALPNDPEILLLSQGDRFVDLTSSLDGTFHDYGRQEPKEKIDYIFASKDVHCNQASLWLEQENAVFLSDHYPVCLEIYTK